MLGNLRRWNTELIDTLFNPTEADAIKLIPLVQRNAQDIMAQMFDPNGNYSAKSGYKVCLENTIAKHKMENQEYNQLFSTLLQFKQTWKTIWDLNIQPRIKVFTWRLARNILPTRPRLLSKNVHVGNGCYLCGGTSEEVWHLFCSCAYFQTAIGFSDVQVQGQMGMHDTATWLEHLQATFTPLLRKDFNLIATLQEGIWRQRNQAWQQKPIVSASRVFLTSGDGSKMLQACL